jgi:hypothetical protein
MDVSSVHVTPLLLEIHILPSITAAANFVPSADIVIPFQFFFVPTELSSVQVTPLLLEVHMFSLSAAAASFVPSDDMVI